MLPLALLLVGLFLGVYLLAGAVVRADPRALAGMVRWGGIVVVAGGLLFLLVTGRLGPALALGAFLLPMLGRWLPVGGWGGGGWRRTGGAAGSAGGSSRVETLTLAMTLDHATGAMAGTVLHGRFAGRALDALSLDELLELRRECVTGDAASLPLLDAWLDRSHPGWQVRESASQAPPPGRRDGGPLSREEAAEILGVPVDATPEEVKAAHRRLMMKMHPDHGGSTYLAAKINEAKERLLGH